VPVPHGAQVPQGVLLHGAHWLAHCVGQALQQVAAGAQVWQAVWHGAQAVWQWLIWNV
jgi:hypothetical protein